ncbi:protein kinase domain-containing protein [Mycolicibacterium tokaiense]|uniref:non-specific serine/threonine protein kinase n=1 Tax=Mycolicibacterium tokaiense TaxID=39695 RepID=A0A378TAK1_9MYCO|nr:protein kinase [Mycolicibacterium tokaiense]BBY87831.1 hypothetical protein MTOK_36130 [Mycolicibacterium tokaiense]STZ57650.1 serine/threonine-protein kinase [Mycolicibacterium tokaiense]
MSNARTWIPSLLGQDVDGYLLNSCIGVGTFGLVFEVTKQSSGSRFAMKILVPNGIANAAAEFDREGTLLDKLNRCSSVVNWIESGTFQYMVVAPNGTSIPIALKYHVLSLASGALDELILDPVQRAALPWPERLAHWRGAVKGIHQMHLARVAHRDLKSGNCLLMVHKGDTQVRIGDLGRSKDMTEPATVPAINYVFGRGDAEFAPPEHLYCQGGGTEADFRNADLYGLGSLFVELATGHPMTALAIGSWQNARNEGEQEFRNGAPRDLSTLRPRYRLALDIMAAEVAPPIRQEAVRLVQQLCDPVPSERQPRPRRGKRYAPDNGLLWLLARADIMSRRLAVETRRTSYKKSRSA